MPDIIHLLPDNVANQIAAGEVVQRPSSVVKELIENAVDAGSSCITLNLKDGGKTLIQVIDDGGGMSTTDARLAFERHATSKISDANDLFAIKTMGFRGEALSSIAAVADVTLKSRRDEDELGTEINIKGSKVVKHEPIACPKGSNFQVKNLFFNIPARRRFLKKDSTELKHVINEFQRVALVYPHIEFNLQNNGDNMYALPKSGLKERIVRIFGKQLNQHIANVRTETSIIKIHGFIGKPEIARKRAGDQFFFVNSRYMRHPYFHRAVMSAFEQIIMPETYPVYFIYLETDPETIDINIHPTKTEIKFENEQAIYKIINSAVREGLGKFNIIPALDFDTSGKFDMPVLNRDAEVKMPGINIDPTFNPFEQGAGYKERPQSFHNKGNDFNASNWESLYDGFQNEPSQQSFTVMSGENKAGGDKEGKTGFEHPRFFQVRNKYILTPVKSGLMVIDQKRAHERILFERFLKSIRGRMGVSQQCLFPQEIELSPKHYVLIHETMPELTKAGFDIEEKKNHTIIMKGLPADAKDMDVQQFIDILIEDLESEADEIINKIDEKLARSLAGNSAIKYGKELSPDEMKELFDKLFACEMPNFSPSGKTILDIINYDDIEQRLN